VALYLLPYPSSVGSTDAPNHVLDASVSSDRRAQEERKVTRCT
jgi:hypothetical protein